MGACLSLLTFLCLKKQMNTLENVSITGAFILLGVQLSIINVQVLFLAKTTKGDRAPAYERLFHACTRTGAGWERSRPQMGWGHRARPWPLAHTKNAIDSVLAKSRFAKKRRASAAPSGARGTRVWASSDAGQSRDPHPGGRSRGSAGTQIGDVQWPLS